jgi:ABC-2 type transport system permease protein
LASFNLSIQDAQVIGTFSKMMGTFLGLIYAILTANSLIASKVDRGSMAYILSTPIKRTTVTNTQILFLLSSIVVTYLLTFAAQMIMFSASDLYFNFGKLLLAYIGYIIF